MRRLVRSASWFWLYLRLSRVQPTTKVLEQLKIAGKGSLPMHAFHLLVGPSETSELQRVDFEAVGPEHAFQIARNESEAAHIELWEGELLLARMSRLDANVWKLLPLIPDTAVGHLPSD